MWALEQRKIFLPVPIETDLPQTPWFTLTQCDITMAPRSSPQWQVFLVGAHHPPTHGVSMSCHRNQHKQRAVPSLALHGEGQHREHRSVPCLWLMSLGSHSEGYTCPKSFGLLTQPHSQTPGMLPHNLFLFISLCRSSSLYSVISSDLLFY